MSELDRYLDDLGGKLERAKPPRSRRPLAAIPLLAVGIVAAVLVFGPGGRRFHQTCTDGSWSEFAYIDGTTTDYDSDSNRQHNVTGYKDTDPQARAFGLFGTGGNDPDADLRTMLAKGKLKDAGLVEADGRTVRRLQGGDPLRRWVYDVDPDTFAPVGGSMTLHFPHGGGEHTTRFYVEVYERIPLGSDVFTIQTRPRPQVSTRTKQQVLAQRAEMQRRVKVWSRCVKRNHGSHKGCGPSPYAR
jgi:hypothetical protein